jgi:phosphoribosylanthranilate isomerase
MVSAARARVKVCGVTNLPDALAAARAKCQAIGFNFYRRSPRYVRPEVAAKIAAYLPRSVARVGVFVNSRESTVRAIARECGLDILQFHGDESPEFCRRFPGYKVVKAFRIRTAADLRGIEDFDTWGYLFDAFSAKRYGGTGRTFEWKLAAGFRGAGKKVFLSGGLSPENVRRALCAVHPDWVEVCSGVESAPGRKDAGKMERFMCAVKGCGI